MTGAFGIRGTYLIKLINSQGRVFASVTSDKGNVEIRAISGHPPDPSFLKNLTDYVRQYRCRTFESKDPDLHRFIGRHIVELINV
jgi:hypothetical protein